MLDFSHPSMVELFTYIFPNGPFLVILFAVLWLALSLLIAVVITRMIKVDAHVDQLQKTIDAKLGLDEGSKKG